jgi:hypothetical protein
MFAHRTESERMTDWNILLFTPQEVEAVKIALDRMADEEEAHASNIETGNPDEYDREVAASYHNEAKVARSAREKFDEAIIQNRQVGTP